MSPIPERVPPRYHAPLMVNLLEVFVKTIPFPLYQGVFASINIFLFVVSIMARTLCEFVFILLTKLFHVLSAVSQIPIRILPDVILLLLSNSNTRLSTVMISPSFG